VRPLDACFASQAAWLSVNACFCRCCSEAEDEKGDFDLQWQPDPVDADPLKSSRSRKSGVCVWCCIWLHRLV
jgi:hypothetical protein